MNDNIDLLKAFREWQKARPTGEQGNCCSFEHFARNDRGDLTPLSDEQIMKLCLREYWWRRYFRIRDNLIN